MEAKSINQLMNKESSCPWVKVLLLKYYSLKQQRWLCSDFVLLTMTYLEAQADHCLNLRGKCC